MSEQVKLGKVAMTLGGDYNSSQSYDKLTCVQYDGCSWVSKKQVPEGVAPTPANSAYWQKISDRGVQGPQGQSYVDKELVPIVNDLTTGGSANVLSAEQGKVLKGELAELSEDVNDITARVESIKPIVINGDVVNASDEEDITSENNLLKLKDRPVVDGMGYVILRNNKTFAEQIIKSNTIYEIRYDFDLKGEELTIGNNCILFFNGGSLANGIIVGQDTTINSDLYAIFNDVKLKGSFKNKCLNAEWFGLSTKAFNNSPFLQNALYSAVATNVFSVCISQFGEYDFVESVKFPSMVRLSGTMSGERSNFNNGIVTFVKKESSPTLIIQEYTDGHIGCGHILIENINFVGSSDTMIQDFCAIALKDNAYGLSNSTIRNCAFSKFYYGINLQFRGGIAYNTFDNVACQYNVIGIRFNSDVEFTSWINANDIRNSSISLNYCGGIEIHTGTLIVMNIYNNTIEQNGFECTPSLYGMHGSFGIKADVFSGILNVFANYTENNGYFRTIVDNYDEATEESVSGFAYLKNPDFAKTGEIVVSGTRLQTSIYNNNFTPVYVPVSIVKSGIVNYYANLCLAIQKPCSAALDSYVAFVDLIGNGARAGLDFKLVGTLTSHNGDTLYYTEPSYLTKAFSLVGVANTTSLSVNIDAPQLGERYFYSAATGESGKSVTLYYDANSTNTKTLPLSKSSAVNNFSSLMSLATELIKNSYVVEICLLSDLTIESCIDLQVFDDKSLIIRGDGDTKRITCKSYFLINSTALTLRNINVVHSNSYLIRVVGNSNIVLDGCSIHYTSNVSTIVVFRGSLYANFKNSTFISDTGIYGVLVNQDEGGVAYVTESNNVKEGNLAIRQNRHLSYTIGTSAGTNAVGAMHYDTTEKAVKVGDGKNWLYQHSFSSNRKYDFGIYRPKLKKETDLGYVFFDKDLGKPIFAKDIDDNGDATWVDANGEVV